MLPAESRRFFALDQRFTILSGIVDLVAYETVTQGISLNSIKNSCGVNPFLTTIERSCLVRSDAVVSGVGTIYFE